MNTLVTAHVIRSGAGMATSGAGYVDPSRTGITRGVSSIVRV
jgi:hypothetical protein